MKIDGPLTAGDLCLRPLTAADARGPYHQWMCDPEILRFLEARFQRHDPESLAGFIARINNDPDSALFAIETRGHHVGNIKLGPINRPHARADIGILIGDRRFHGRGIGTGAIRLLCDWAFTTLGLHKLTAGCYANNHASRRAFEKAGFQLEGTLTAHSWEDRDGWVDCFLLGRLAPPA